MYTYVHEGPEIGDVVDDAGENHPFAQVTDFVDGLVKRERRGASAGIASGLAEFADDVGQSRQTHIVSNISGEVDAVKESRVGDKLFQAMAAVAGDTFHGRIAFGMDGRIVEDIFPVAHTQEPGGLFVGFRSETRYFQQGASGSEVAVFSTVGHDIGRQNLRYRLRN